MRGDLNFIEYLDRIRELIPFDFEEAVVFDKYLQLMGVTTQELQKVFKDLLELRSIDTAEGKQLDIIGKIVGQERELVDVDLFEFFGFQGNFQSGSFGSMDDPTVGAVFRGNGDPTKGNILLTDGVYRLFIKAKIAKNVTRATPEDIMHFTNFVFDTKGSSVEEEGGGVFRIAVGRYLTRAEVGILRYVNKTANFETSLLPIPIGVRVWFSSFNHERVFAFAGVPNAMGFGGMTSYKYDGVALDDKGDPIPNAPVNTFDGSITPRAIGQGNGGYLATLHGEI